MSFASEQVRYCRKCGVEHPLTSEHWLELKGPSPRCKVQRYAYLKSIRDPEKAAAQNRSWRERNREKVLADHRKWREANGDRHRANARKWYEENRECARVRKNAYQNQRSREDLEFRIGKNVRTRLYLAFKGVTKRPASAVRDLGCSLEQLKQHLEEQFTPEMTWQNYGELWEIDHILPLGNYDLTDRGTLRRLVHYTNLQPLSKSVNRSMRNKEK